MGSIDRNVIDLELTPIFTSMCEQLGMYRELTTAADGPDHSWGDYGRHSGSLDVAGHDVGDGG